MQWQQKRLQTIEPVQYASFEAHGVQTILAVP
jgi:hypothetical protein